MSIKKAVRETKRNYAQLLAKQTKKKTTSYAKNDFGSLRETKGT